MRRILPLALLLLVAADDALVTTHVAGTVHVISGPGGNIGVSVGEDGILLIDDKFEPLAPRIKKEVKKLSKKKLGFIINTHFHGDHTGGNMIFGREAPIIAHHNVRTRLSQPDARRGTKALAAPGLPVVTFAESVSLHYNGEEIKVIHLPRGHTDGDSVVWFTKSNVIHMGDHMFFGKFPFIDLDSGGNVASYTENVARVIAMIPEDIKIIPGHGAPMATRKDLVAFHAMLVETRRVVEGELAKGKAPEAIQLPAQYAGWATAFVDEKKWIATIALSKTGR